MKSSVAQETQRSGSRSSSTSTSSAVFFKRSPKTQCLLLLNLFVLRFYGSVNPMGSCRARSVYLTTRLLGRLSPLSS